MSLIAWYPLNGSIENKGVRDMDLTVSGSDTPTFVAGKTGKAATASFTASLSAAQVESFLSGGKYSICFWHKTVKSSGTAPILGANASRYFTIFQYPTPTDLHWDFKPNGTGTQICSSIIAGALPLNEWVHLAFTYDGTTFTIYKNGLVIHTKQISLVNTTYDSQPLFLYNDFNERSDLRLYDHCLSQKEVAEIAKGLVLHYPLNDVDGVVRGRNLLKKTPTKGGNSIVDSNNNIVLSGADSDTYFYLTPYSEITAGKTYTISCDCSGLAPGAVYVFNFTDQNSSTYIKIDRNGRNYNTVTWPTTVAANNKFILDDTKRPRDGVQVTLSNFKLELGSVATPFTPAPEDDPLTTTIVRDCSGFGNDGTVSGELTCKDAGAVGFLSTYFANDAKITCPFQFDNSVTDYTVSFWYKQNTTEQMPLSFTSPNRLNYYFRTNSVYWNTFDGEVNPMGSISATADDTWHLYTFVHTSTTVTAYKDGVSQGNAKTYKPLVATGLRINGYEGVTGEYNNSGSIEDVRIYATALSESAIKELYQTRFQLANNGTLFCTEMANGDSSRMNRNGVVNSSMFNEIPNLYDMPVKVLDDGSCWVRLFYHNNHAGTVLWSTSDPLGTEAVIKDKDRYSRLYLIPQFYNNGVYEFMTCQPDDGDGVWRWKQTNNPLVSTTAGTVTAVLGYAYDSLGLVKCNSCTLMAHTSTGNNWWCAVGANTTFQGGIPGWGSVAVKGGLELWIRFDNVPGIVEKLNITKEALTAREIIEY